jgi:hypothetical protein
MGSIWFRLRNPDGTGTKFGLVALELPGHLSFGDNSKDKQ